MENTGENPSERILKSNNSQECRVQWVFAGFKKIFCHKFPGFDFLFQWTWCSFYHNLFWPYSFCTWWLSWHNQCSTVWQQLWLCCCPFHLIVLSVCTEILQVDNTVNCAMIVLSIWFDSAIFLNCTIAGMSRRAQKNVWLKYFPVDGCLDTRT